MRTMALALSSWLLVCASASTAQTRVDPLFTAKSALLQGDSRNSWPALVAAWPALGSEAQRRAWQGMLAALNEAHCGRDFPLTLPPDVQELTLELIQRDAPLLRDYRVQLIVRGAVTAAELRDPQGRDRLAGAQWEAEAEQRTRVIGADQAAPLSPGVYQFRLVVAGKPWQVTLPLVGAQSLDWLSRAPLGLANPPAQSAACNRLSLDQAILTRPGFSLEWWHRQGLNDKVTWPTASPNAWRTLSLVRTEQRGPLVLKVSHSQAGPAP